MDPESLQADWALWLGLASLIVAIAVLLPQLLQRTSRGQLKVAVAALKQVRKDYRKSVRALKKAEKKAHKLMARADRIKPRVLQEAREAVEDGKALARIFSDKLMVARNSVRLVIHEEFPPARHERMSKRYLPADETDEH